MLQKTLSILSRSRKANKATINSLLLLFHKSVRSGSCVDLKMRGDETSTAQLPLLGGKFFTNIEIDIFFKV